MGETYIETSHHPNGQLRWEGHFKNGSLAGPNRHWHENGQLSYETFFDDDGLEHGTANQWDQNGKILGQYSMEHGTGISRNWHENGQIRSEFGNVHGKWHGRSRHWFEDGELIGTEYHILGKKVSQKKYAEACKNDPALPRYTEDATTKNIKKRIVNKAITQAEKRRHEDLILKFRSDINQAEVRQWLKANPDRALGDLSSDESLELVEAGYLSGATKIIAVEIQDDVSTDCLIAEVPSDPKLRKQVFQWHNDRAESAGWDPDADWGQKELFLFFG